MAEQHSQGGRGNGGASPATNSAATPQRRGSRQRPATAKPAGAESVEERWDFYYWEFQDMKAIAKKLAIALIAMVILMPCAYQAGVIFTKKGGVIGIDEQGRAVDIPQITDPVLSDAAIRRFASESVEEEGTFGFADFDMRFKLLQDRFTKDGWRKLNNAFEKSQIRASVLKWYQNYSTQTTGPCAIVNSGLVNGRYWWKVECQAVRRITVGKEHSDTNLKITMEIIRVGFAEARELAAIDRWEE